MIFKMKQVFVIIGLVFVVSSCTMTIPLTSDESIQSVQKTDSEIKKEEALNVQKVKAEEKARQAEEQKNESQTKQPTKGDGDGGI